jgi:GntR family transcriptional regulator, galactonate operon transcriptional repressor
MQRTYTPVGLHGRLVHELGRRIVRGDLAPGEPIAVDDLPGDAGSRTVVRETMRVLTAKGLVEPKPKVGTRVRPREHWNLLDPDVLAWQREVAIGPRALRDLGEVRAIVEPAASRLAAERHTAATLAPIVDAHARMRSAAGLDDREGFVEADVDFHSAILAASDNELLRALSDVIVAALRARDRLALARVGVTDESVRTHAAVLDAIGDGDGDRAERAMRELVESAAGDTAGLNGDAGA